jgi:hypothetical protein
LTTNNGEVERERRIKPRIKEPFPLSLVSVDEAGHSYTFETMTENMSASGLYFNIAQPLEKGTMVYAFLRIPRPGAEGETRMLMATEGQVVRTDLMPQGNFGIAVAFTRHQIL